MNRHHRHRYYDQTVEDGRLRKFEHPINLLCERKYEGERRIQTNLVDLTPAEATRPYEELNGVEWGAQAAKSPAGMRPIWHRAGRRVRSQALFAALAFLMERMLDRALKGAGTTLVAEVAWSAL